MYYIYKIENKINNKKYIGLTNNIIRRKNRHFSDLKRQVHDNHFLQKEFNIYGQENFDFEIIESEIPENEISNKEKEYIKFYDSYKNGYNQNEGGNFGPSNGGTTLIEADLLAILSCLEFISKPGQVLANIFNVTRTTISRIKRGINHIETYNYYNSLTLEERKEIFNTFDQSLNIKEIKAKTTIIPNKRKLNQEQVFLILLNKELKFLIPQPQLMKKFGIKSSNTFYCIYKGQSYQDYFIEYKKLNKEQKEKLASLLSNQ